jgi:hypothetical protein
MLDPVTGFPVDAPRGLVAVLGEFTYLPKWEFRLRQGLPQPGLWTLHVRTWVEDSRHPGTHGRGHWGFTVWDEPDAPREFWVEWLRKCMREIAMHEVDEWFLVGGVRLFDPHAGQAAPGPALARG